MHVVAEMLAALVLGLATAAFSWFGLALESREPTVERTVRKTPAATPAHAIAPEAKPDMPIPC